MINKPNRNTEGLKEFAEQKNQKTIEKVNKVIDRLKRSKTKKINFKTVAKKQEYLKLLCIIMIFLKNVF